MIESTTKMSITRYEDESQGPTCAANFNENKVCVFLRLGKFGIQEKCIFSDLPLERRDKTGLLIPAKECPLW